MMPVALSAQKENQLWLMIIVGERYGSKQNDVETLNYTLSHKLGNEQSVLTSKRMNTAECASEASGAEQVN